MKRLAALLPLSTPRTASACAVCFGQADGKSGFFNGLWWGIALLLLVTMSLVAGIGWAIWSVERRREKDA